MQQLLNNIQDLNNQNIVELSIISNKKEELQKIEEIVLERMHLFEVNQLVCIINEMESKNAGSQQFYLEVEREIGMRKDELEMDDVIVLFLAMLNQGRNKMYLLLENLVVDRLDELNQQQLVVILFCLDQRKMLTMELYQLLESKLMEDEQTLHSLPLVQQSMIQSSVFKYITRDSPLLNYLYTFNQSVIDQNHLPHFNHDQFLSFLHNYHLLQDIPSSHISTLKSHLL